MKKITKIAAVVMAAAMTLALAACGGSKPAATTAAPAGGDKPAATTAAPADNTVYRLSVSFHDSSEALKTQYVQKWADAVKEASNGRLDVTVYAGGTIAGAADALDAVKQQTADIAVCFSGFFPGQFTLSDVITLPLLGASDSVTGTKILWDCYESTPEMAAEYDEFKVIMLYAGPNNIICTSKPVKTVEDIAGLKLRASAGTATDITTAWKGTPMSISSAELYQSMEKNVIDGYIIDWTGVNAWNLYEVTTDYLELPFFTQTWAVLMNKDSYNALPADLQAIIDEYSGRDWSLGFGDLNEEEAGDARQKAIDGGATVTTVEGDGLASFEPACSAYVESWIEKNSANGFDAKAYVEKVKGLIAEYKK